VAGATGLRSISLRSRAALFTLPVLVLALGLVGLAVDAANYRGAVSALQLRMESYVYAVLAAMEVDSATGLSVDEDFADPRLQQPGSGLYVLVRGSGDAWRSPSSLGVALPDPAEVPAGEFHFSEPGDGPEGAQDRFVYRYGIGWQVEDGTIRPYTVSVLIDRSDFDQQARAFRAGLWRSLVLAALILILAQGVILFLVFRPLGKVARDVARIESGQADRLEDNYPRELEPLARNVNRLLATEKSNQERIRNALDSLAHSLKTPLAVIQSGLSRQGSGADESIQKAVDEMNHLVTTRLERAGRSARRALAAPVAVAGQLQRVLDSMKKVHSHKMIAADVILEEKLAFHGEQRDLLELLGNLVDNAFKYGRSRVVVRGGAIGADHPRPGLWLRVEDDGEGIDAARRDKLLQRGMRGDERVEGHGLGLAIVHELAAAYGGELSIGSSELGGASVEVRLPPS
jgi:two-component system sensor histidine kinase PhoQ